MQNGDSGSSRALSVDHHATTPVATEVVEAMMPYFIEEASNAHSAHSGGERAAHAVAVARASVARLIDAAPSEIVFTSGATEANNLAILGIARATLAGGSVRRRIITTAIEHKCVLEAAKSLVGMGFIWEILPVTHSGFADLGDLERRLADDVLLVSMIAANNEIGTIQPLQEAGELVARHGAVFHVDAAQAAGRIPFSVMEAGCDLASISGHKFYGPKGVGALFVSAATPLRPAPIMFGGGQEQGLRPGTLPVPLIVGFGRAADLARAGMQADGAHLRALGSKFLERLREEGVEFELNGAAAPRLPGSLNIRVVGVAADDVIARVGDRLLLSSGSACMSGELQGSYVLRALDLDERDVASSFRICFSRFQTLRDAELAAKILADALNPCNKATGGDVQWRRDEHGSVHGTGVQAPICRP